MCLIVVAYGFMLEMIDATIDAVQMQTNVNNDELYAHDALPPLYGL